MSMEEKLNIKSALEYYIMAGVDEILGDEPFGVGLAEKKFSQEIPSLKKAPVILPLAAEKIDSGRQATTELAQATLSACQNAHDICAAAQTLDELRTAVENFDGCALKLTASHTVFGDGNPNARLVLVGEAPGADEDRIGRPFVGRSGHLLDKMMNAVGMDRSAYFITNVLPWRPPGNRTPTSAEIAVCLPFLKRQIELINPEYILILGGSAANALLDNQEPISRLRGRWLEYEKSDGEKIQVLASFHPAYLLRNTAQKARAWSDLLRLKKTMQ